MDNSNDLRSPLRRLMEEVRSHYEVTYSPVSTNFDGHFRKLAVHLTRPGVTVQSRAGYYALPMVGGEALAPFEMAALKVLTTQPEPHAFAFHAAAPQFGAAAGGHIYRVVVSIPSSSLRFVEEPAKKSVAIHVSALGLIKDERGQVVRKVSKDLYCRAANTTYTLTVQNAGGTNTCSATVTVNPITQLSFSRTSQTPKQSLSCHCWLKLTSNVSPETARLHLKTYFVR